MNRTVDRPQLEQQVEALGRELDELRRRVRALERGGAPAASAADRAAADVANDIAGAGAAATAAEERAGLGRMSTLFGRAAVACFLLVVALALRALADGQLLAVEHGVWLGVGYAVALCAVGWRLWRRGAGQAPTCSLTGSVLLGSVLLEGVLRHHVVPLPAAYVVLAGVAAGTGWFLDGRRSVGALWVAGAALLGAGGGLLLAGPALPWPVLLALMGCTMAGHGGGAGRLVFRCGAWLALTALWAGWGLHLASALAGGGPVPAHLAPGWFGGTLAATCGYFLVAATWQAARRPARWADAFDAVLLPLTLGWAHLLGLWLLPALGASTALLGGLEVGAAAVLLAAAWGLGRAAGEPRPGATAAGLLTLAAAAALVLGLPAALGGTAAVVVWAAAAHAVAGQARRWGSGGARLAAYGLPAAGCVYSWVAGEAPASTALAAAALAAVLQYRAQRRWPVPTGSRFFATVDRSDDLGALPLVAAVGYGVLALRGWSQVLLAGLGADASTGGAVVVSVAPSLAALALVVWGQRAGDSRVRSVGVVVLAAAALRVFGYDLLASGGLPLVCSVLGFGVAAGGAALALRRPFGGGPAPQRTATRPAAALESEHRDA